MTDFLDFNTDEPTTKPATESSTQAIKQQLLARIDSALLYLFPDGVIRQQQFVVGNVNGDRGKSLVVERQGERVGLWTDFATGEGGDILDLWARAKRLDTRRDFAIIVKEIEQWLGVMPSTPSSPAVIEPPKDELGERTGKWDYTDANGQLIACVYRYDPPSGKEFRPWDVKARQGKAPTPRPLYNQVGVSSAHYVVLVEGEKAADALMQAGIVATTAMNGANAPIDKTDWSPLQNKHIAIWPDNDEPGKAYAEQVAHALGGIVQSVGVLSIPHNKPAKWDAADAVEEGIAIESFIRDHLLTNDTAPPPLPAFSLGELLEDTSPIPDDLIGPRVLTPGGMVVLGGAAKVGKSDFVLSWLTYMAAGESFLNLKPSRRLRIFYLQAEVQYHYLRERLQLMQLPEMLVWRAAENLLITPQLNMILNDEGLARVVAALQKASEKEPIDVIVIDPLRNVFDGGDENASENDNQAMLYFLRERIEKLRQAVNPDAGIVIVHHTKKINKHQLIEDPFLSLSGAGALRGYYTTGMLLYRPDENQSHRKLTFELRNGPALPTKTITKQSGRWIELDHESERLVNQHHGEKLDAERIRKRNVVAEIVYEEGQHGRFYTANQFAEKFDGQKGLGGKRSINEAISVSATKGEVKFFRNTDAYHLAPVSRSRFGYLCTEGLHIVDFEIIDRVTGETRLVNQPVKPTHYKCPYTGQPFVEESPDVWIYREENDE